jgi:L-2-hydroxyglutarate oxidase
VLDVVVAGAGIVGLATARALLAARPGLSVAVCDKEPALARHQTGRNSGVIHSGVYYRPGSLKARTCAAGRAALLRYCAERGIRHAVPGKVIVATDAAEVDRLANLEQRARANGVEVARLDAAALRRVEPNAAGLAALHVPGTGVVDFAAVAAAYADDVVTGGGRLLLATPVLRLDERPGEVVAHTPAGELVARVALNCAGLHADVLAGPAAGDVRIVPFRGEFHRVETHGRELVRGLVYPVPDPALPFLGVHVTRGIDGEVHAGPNAVLALAREGYRRRDADWREVLAILRHPGTRHLVRRHWRAAVGEVRRSLSRRAFARAVQRLVPAIDAADLHPAPAGVRAQALAPDGTLLDDFVVRETPRAVHVLSAPSPAATASLEIGRILAERVLSRL